MKPITTSVYTFRRLVDGGFLYVDKTELLWRLVEPPRGAYFLSRPRRFGKSLTLSTLEEILLGNRELFRGLAIYDKPFEWKEHPVIRIDLGSKQAASADELKECLAFAVTSEARRHGVELADRSPHLQFEELIRRLAERERVVVLIDEYDKPILGNIRNPGVVNQIRDVLGAFYSVIKSADRYLRFAFLTGVSKFNRASVFSDLNNLDDLTMDARFSTLCGYTQEELEANFAEYLDRLAEREGAALPEVLGHVREWYNGYRFSEGETAVYNPVSVGRLLDSGKFSNYWFETGTPSFLIRRIRETGLDLEAVANAEVGEVAFAAYDVERLEVLPLLFQTGYLTIRDAFRDGQDWLYRLGFPNREVEQSFNVYLVDSYTQVPKELAQGHLAAMARALRATDIEELFRRLRIFFADIPYDIQLADEKYYQTVFYLLFRLIGIRLQVEVRTESGRIDAVVETDSTIFIFEFKLQGTAQEALDQIREKRYYEKYLADGRSILLIGAAFDPGTRNLERWVTSPPPGKPS